MTADLNLKLRLRQRVMVLMRSDGHVLYYQIKRVANWSGKQSNDVNETLEMKWNKKKTKWET